MDAIKIQLWGQHAAEALISDGCVLNDSIAKVASDNDLNQYQISQVIAAANHKANDHFRGTARDKTYTFDLAELDSVLGSLNSEGPDTVSIDKIASVLDSFQTGLGETSFEKRAEAATAFDDRGVILRKKRVDHALSCAIEKIAQYDRQNDAAKQTGMMELQTELGELTQVVREYLMGKEASWGEIKKYASMLGEEAQLHENIMGVVQAQLEKLGHPYPGLLASGKDFKKPDRERAGMAVEAPPIEVINGNTPIAKKVIAIDARMRNLDAKTLLKHELDSLSSYLILQQRELKNNDDVDAYMVDEIETFADVIAVGPESVKKYASPLMLAAGAAKLVPKVFGAAKKIAKTPFAKNVAKNATKSVVTAYGAGKAITGAGAAAGGRFSQGQRSSRSDAAGGV